MEADTLRLLLLLDHDNLPFPRLSLRTLIEKWLTAIESDLPPLSIGSIRVRAYGGWYSADSVTEARYRAAEFYQAHCPAVFTFEKRYYRTAFEFADRLIEHETLQPSLVRITHTVASRKLGQYLKIRKGLEVCPEQDCRLREIRRWVVSKRACPHPRCPRQFFGVFERTEQKQVDVHLAIDIARYVMNSAGGDHLAIVSDDWDLLPAVLTAAETRGEQSTVTLIRCKPGGTYIDAILNDMSVTIVNLSESLGGTENAGTRD